MQTNYLSVKLNKGQYLSSVEPFKTNGVPSDHIIHKTVTGCGVTTLEIEHTKRHSIIILPNVPVIRGKVEERNTPENTQHRILGVHEGVELDDVEAYLKSDSIYKKILTTPEGFISKVMKAFADDLDVMFNDYFMLFDECERIVTDVSYRGNIAAPMKYFFRFEKKAVVSATTLPFSDDRFKDLKHILIEPTYDHSKAIKVLDTNNILESFKRHVKELNSEHIAIFLNSTNTIFAIIDAMDIKEESMVFCGKDSVKSLADKAFRNASHLLDKDIMKRYTFYTSRFFSAVDIIVDYTPDVVMITDVYFAEHSILDPVTEVIQASGRYRNGINSLTHISNFNTTLESKSEQEARYYLEGCFDTYKGFDKSYRSEEHPGSKYTLLAAITSSPVHNFFDDGELNTFMVDNYISEQRVIGYYQKPANLKDIYDQLRSHFKPAFKSENYALGDYDRLQRGVRMPIKEHHKLIAEQIDKLTPRPGHFVFEPEGIRDSLRSSYPLIAKAYDLIGLEKLNNTHYINSEIVKAIRIAEKDSLYKMLSAFVYDKFSSFNTYEEPEIIKALTKIYSDHNVNEEAKAAHIKRYFIGRRSSNKDGHVYKLIEKLI